ncbi:hypothetical protein [Clostridium sp. JNZ J1-5]
MLSKRKKIYADDLVEITQGFLQKIKDINEKLCEDNLVNQGLFLMANSLFEDSIRELMKIILISFPEKLELKSCTITKAHICEIADRGHEVIIENELYLLFREGVVAQLEYLTNIICGKKTKEVESDIETLITKCADISLYRNSLIHNRGKPSKDLFNKAQHYKCTSSKYIDFNIEMIKKFLGDYESLFIFLECKIKEKFKFYEQITRIQKLKELWYRCFASPVLVFEDYWEVNTKHDVVMSIKRCKYEEVISSGESVYLSIWRHQYDDRYKSQEFLLCSIDHLVICDMYNVFDEVKFYYMSQEADRIKHG